MYDVNELIPHPKSPQDDEIILGYKSDLEISMNVIVEIIEVEPKP
jgi:hypothetical protein